MKEKKNKEKRIIETALVEAKPLTRFLAWLADFFIMALVGVCLYTWVSFPIAKASTSYDQNIVRRTEDNDAMGEILVDTYHLLEWNDDSDSDNPYKDIKKTYETYSKNKATCTSVVSEDLFATYWTNLRANETIDIKTFNIEVLGLPKEGEENTSLIWEYKVVSDVIIYDEIGILQNNFALYLNDYINGEQYAEALEANDDLSNFFLISWNNAYNDVSTNDATFKALMQEYNDLAYINNWILSVPSIITYVIVMVVFYLVIPLCFSNGQTISKKILKISLADMYGYKVSKPQIVARFFVMLIEEIGSMVFFPMFIVGFFSIWGLPFIPFGATPITMSVALITTIIFMLGSGILALATPYKQSLHDIAARTRVVNPNESVIFSSKEEKEQYFIDQAIYKHKKEMGEID